MTADDQITGLRRPTNSALDFSSHSKLSNRMLAIYVISLVAFTLILSIQSSEGASFNAIGKSRSGRDRGCYYMLQHYKNGEQIKTDEPCLNCTCENSMLMCYLKVCPYVKPVGDRCIIERVPGECCPRIVCSDASENVDSIEQELEQETASPTTTPVSLPLDTYANTSVYQSQQLERDESRGGCTFGGKFYSEGAQMPSDPSKPCEVCYCIKNSSACVMQDCALEVSGCAPVHSAGGCCPTRYNCSSANAFTTPKPGFNSEFVTSATKRRFWQSMYDMRTTPSLSTSSISDPSSPTTTTARPFSYPEFGRRVGPAGVGCKVANSSKIFADGERVPSRNKCEHCYCMRTEIVCAVQECRPPCDGCVPIIEPNDSCCPKRYECAAPAQLVPVGENLDAQESPSSTTANPTDASQSPSTPPDATQTTVALNMDNTTKPANDSNLSQDQAQNEVTFGTPKQEFSVMTTRQTKPPLKPISPKLTTNEEETSGLNRMSPDEETGKNNNSQEQNPTNVDGFSLHNEREQESGVDKSAVGLTEPQPGTSMQNPSSADQNELIPPSLTSTLPPRAMNHINGAVGMSTDNELSPSEATGQSRKSRPLVVPSSIPGEGSCRYNGRSYKNGQEVQSKHNCTEVCMCINSVVYCDEVDCPRAPDNVERCEKIMADGDCCPKYICPSGANAENFVKQDATTGTASTSTEPSTSTASDQTTPRSILTPDTTRPATLEPVTELAASSPTASVSTGAPASGAETSTQAAETTTTTTATLAIDQTDSKAQTVVPPSASADQRAVSDAPPPQTTAPAASLDQRPQTVASTVESQTVAPLASVGPTEAQPQTVAPVATSSTESDLSSTISPVSTQFANEAEHKILDGNVPINTQATSIASSSTPLAPVESLPTSPTEGIAPMVEPTQSTSSQIDVGSSTGPAAASDSANSNVAAAPEISANTITDVSASTSAQPTDSRTKLPPLDTNQSSPTSTSISSPSPAAAATELSVTTNSEGNSAMSDVTSTASSAHDVSSETVAVVTTTTPPSSSEETAVANGAAGESLSGSSDASATVTEGPKLSTEPNFPTSITNEAAASTVADLSAPSSARPMDRADRIPNVANSVEVTSSTQSFETTPNSLVESPAQPAREPEVSGQIGSGVAPSGPAFDGNIDSRMQPVAPESKSDFVPLSSTTVSEPTATTGTDDGSSTTLATANSEQPTASPITTSSTAATTENDTTATLSNNLSQQDDKSGTTTTSSSGSSHSSDGSAMDTRPIDSKNISENNDSNVNNSELAQGTSTTAPSVTSSSDVASASPEVSLKETSAANVPEVTSTPVATETPVVPTISANNNPIGTQPQTFAPTTSTTSESSFTTFATPETPEPKLAPQDGSAENLQPEIATAATSSSAQESSQPATTVATDVDVESTLRPASTDDGSSAADNIVANTVAGPASDSSVQPIGANSSDNQELTPEVKSSTEVATPAVASSSSQPPPESPEDATTAATELVPSRTPDSTASSSMAPIETTTDKPETSSAAATDNFNSGPTDHSAPAQILQTEAAASSSISPTVEPTQTTVSSDIQSASSVSAQTEPELVKSWQSNSDTTPAPAEQFTVSRSPADLQPMSHKENNEIDGLVPVAPAAPPVDQSGSPAELPAPSSSNTPSTSSETTDQVDQTQPNAIADTDTAAVAKSSIAPASLSDAPAEVQTQTTQSNLLSASSASISHLPNEQTPMLPTESTSSALIENLNTMKPVEVNLGVNTAENMTAFGATVTLTVATDTTTPINTDASMSTVSTDVTNDTARSGSTLMDSSTPLNNEIEANTKSPELALNESLKSNEIIPAAQEAKPTANMQPTESAPGTIASTFVRADSVPNAPPSNPQVGGQAPVTIPHTPIDNCQGATCPGVRIENNGDVKQDAATTGTASTSTEASTSTASDQTTPRSILTPDTTRPATLEPVTELAASSPTASVSTGAPASGAETSTQAAETTTTTTATLAIDQTDSKAQTVVPPSASADQRAVSDAPPPQTTAPAASLDQRPQTVASTVEPQTVAPLASVGPTEAQPQTIAPVGSSTIEPNRSPTSSSAPPQTIGEFGMDTSSAPVASSTVEPQSAAPPTSESRGAQTVESIAQPANELQSVAPLASVGLTDAQPHTTAPVVPPTTEPRLLVPAQATGEAVNRIMDVAVPSNLQADSIAPSSTPLPPQTQTTSADFTPTLVPNREQSNADTNIITDASVGINSNAFPSANVHSAAPAGSTQISSADVSGQSQEFASTVATQSAAPAVPELPLGPSFGLGPASNQPAAMPPIQATANHNLTTGERLPSAAQPIDGTQPALVSEAISTTGPLEADISASTVANVAVNNAAMQPVGSVAEMSPKIVEGTSAIAAAPSVASDGPKRLDELPAAAPMANVVPGTVTDVVSSPAPSDVNNINPVRINAENTTPNSVSSSFTQSNAISSTPILQTNPIESQSSQTQPPSAMPTSSAAPMTPEITPPVSNLITSDGLQNPQSVSPPSSVLAVEPAQATNSNINGQQAPLVPNQISTSKPDATRTQPHLDTTVSSVSQNAVVSPREQTVAAAETAMNMQPVSHGHENEVDGSLANSSPMSPAAIPTEPPVATIPTATQLGPESRQDPAQSSAGVPPAVGQPNSANANPFDQQTQTIQPSLAASTAATPSPTQPVIQPQADVANDVRSDNSSNQDFPAASSTIPPTEPTQQTTVASRVDVQPHTSAPSVAPVDGPISTVAAARTEMGANTNADATATASATVPSASIATIVAVTTAATVDNISSSPSSQTNPPSPTDATNVTMNNSSILEVASTTVSPAEQFIMTKSSNFEPVNVSTVIPSIRGSSVTITIPWADIKNNSSSQSTTTESPHTNSPNVTWSYSHEPTSVTESDYEEISEDSGCEYEGKTYNSAQQIPRSHPCDFCFCFRGDIVCLQQTCPPPVPHCFETVIDGFCCPRYECPVHTLRAPNNSSALTLTPYETHSRLHAHNHEAQTAQSAARSAANVKGCFVENKLYHVGQVIESASGPCLECKCDKNGMMRCNPKECTPEDPLLQQINREVLQSSLTRSR